jgi:hypothetical protein
VSPVPKAGSEPALVLMDQARLVGAYRWIELELFELLGRWVSDEPEPRARVFFDTSSRQHAWHAELFAGRLPVLDGVDPDQFTVTPGREVQSLFDSARGTEPTGSRLFAMARVLVPRLVGGYERHLGRAVAVADAPLIRALRLAVRDDLEELEAAEALFEELIGASLDPRFDGELDLAQGEPWWLDEAVVAGGPGFVAWPGPDPPAQEGPPGEMRA